MPLNLSRRLRARLADERGFTLVTVLGVMAVIVLFSVGAMTAVNGDLAGSGDDVGRKQALAAAEVGVSDYLFHLNADSAYWTKCTAAGPGLNDPWTGSKPPANANWRQVPGAPSQAYAIELLPARNKNPATNTYYTACDPDPESVYDSMVDPGTKGLRIRVTGKATSAKGSVTRSVVTTVRRTSFLDYLWFTDYETTDPVWFATQTKGYASKPAAGWTGDLLTWAATNCPRYYRTGPAGVTAGYNRAGTSWKGQIDSNNDGSFSGEATVTRACTLMDPQFASTDELLGPVHTNDELLVCNNFTLGRPNSGDSIESGAAWRPCTTGAAPKIQGTWTPNAPTIRMPPTDASLGQIASPAYTFTGRTAIKLRSDSKIEVTNPNVNGGAMQVLDYPSNGVLYVKNGTCGYSYQPLNPYNQSGSTYSALPSYPPPRVPAGCGDVWLSGTYDKSLTIAAQDDIIVTDDVTNSAADMASSDQRLGLIADNFVRVGHPVNRTNAGDLTVCTEPSGAARIADRRIDAAILSLQHSFMVDNYYCGGLLGTLTVNGVIAQKLRGPVGTTGGTGFKKDYNYDERLSYKGPPHFLDPIQSAWKTTGWTEQQGPH